MDSEVVNVEAGTESGRFDRRSFLTGLGFLGAGIALSGIAGTAGRVVNSAGLSPQEIAADSVNERQVSSVESIAERVKDAVWRVDSGNQSGSSFLISKNVLATNAHVVSGGVGDSVAVGKSGGQKITGKILMVDSGLDLALVSVPDQDGVEPLKFVSVAHQRAGQDVFIAGYPIGLNLSFNAGNISAVDQVTTMRESYAQSALLQIDAATNPGDSGGPVLDLSGNVVGITTFRPDTSGGRAVQGIAFALPSDDVLIAMQQFKDFGNVKYGYLGVSFSGVLPEMGAAIDNVVGGSPASVAGLQAGDVIVGVGGVDTVNYPAISRELHKRRPGDKVSIAYKRDNGDARTVEVTLASSEGDASTSIG